MAHIINIDALVEEPPFILEIGGVQHPMRVFSVDDFLVNMKEIEALGANPAFADELEVAIRIIGRAFPTLGEAEVRKFQVSTIDKLFRISRGEDPAKLASGASEGEAENPPKAN